MTFIKLPQILQRRSKVRHTVTTLTKPAMPAGFTLPGSTRGAASREGTSFTLPGSTSVYRRARRGGSRPSGGPQVSPSDAPRGKLSQDGYGVSVGKAILASPCRVPQERSNPRPMRHIVGEWVPHSGQSELTASCGPSANLSNKSPPHINIATKRLQKSPKYMDSKRIYFFFLFVSFVFGLEGAKPVGQQNIVDD